MSATRKGAHGKHGKGEAIDFQLEGVSAATLAAYLRGTPLAGIGIYTHPKTQYVHLDVRAHSYHWLDGSPPGVTWREKLLGDPSQEKRDASYDSSKLRSWVNAKGRLKPRLSVKSHAITVPSPLTVYSVSPFELKTDCTTALEWPRSVS